MMRINQEKSQNRNLKNRYHSAITPTPTWSHGNALPRTPNMALRADDQLHWLEVDLFGDLAERLQIRFDSGCRFPRR